MPTLVDTHCHLDAEAFDADREEVVERARASGVSRLIAVATNAASAHKGLELAKAYPGVFPTAGIHPNYAAAAGPTDWDQVTELAQSGQVVALGETGLDRHWDDTPWDVQRDYFARHFALSRTTGLPLVIHMRDCEDEMLTALREEHRHGPLSGVMHSFTGSAAMAAECVAMGLFVGFAGMVTFKKSHDLREVARSIPAERILVETDSPYLSPEPLRGRRNEPAHVVHTARLLAEVRGAPVDDFAALTTANARNLFRLEA